MVFFSFLFNPGFCFTYHELRCSVRHLTPHKMNRSRGAYLNQEEQDVIMAMTKELWRSLFFFLKRKEKKRATAERNTVAANKPREECRQESADSLNS